MARSTPERAPAVSRSSMTADKAAHAALPGSSPLSSPGCTSKALSYNRKLFHIFKQRGRVLHLDEIRNAYREFFPEDLGKKWDGGIRHNLSQNKQYTSVGDQLWEISLDAIADDRIRPTSQSRSKARRHSLSDRQKPAHKRTGSVQKRQRAIPIPRTALSSASRRTVRPRADSRSSTGSPTLASDKSSSGSSSDNSESLFLSRTGSPTRMLGSTPHSLPVSVFSSPSRHRAVSTHELTAEQLGSLDRSLQQHAALQSQSATQLPLAAAPGFLSKSSSEERHLRFVYTPTESTSSPSGRQHVLLEGSRNPTLGSTARPHRSIRSPSREVDDDGVFWSER